MNKTFFKTTGIAILIFLILIQALRMTVNTVRKDAAFIENAVSDSSMVKVGEATGKTMNTLESRKNNFLKGYEKTKDSQPKP